MIIHDLDLLRPLIAPPEHDPPLIVYPDRMLSSQVPSQGFQAISRRHYEIAEHRPRCSVAPVFGVQLWQGLSETPLERVAAGKSTPRTRHGSF